MGGRGGSSGISASGGGISATEERIFNSIRDKKRENLIVYDDKGNIVAREGGTKSHTGYEEHDYEGMNAVHNHPQGVGYYPSNQDLATLHNSGAKSMTVVSPEHTIKIIRTEKVSTQNYAFSSDATVSNAKSMFGRSPFGNLSPSQYREKYGLSIKQINKMKADFEVKRIKEFMERQGYKVIVRGR